MRRITTALACTLLFSILAGCFDDDEPDSPDDGSFDFGAATDLPPGCDGSRIAVAHHVGGHAVAPSLRIVPCFHRIGTGSFEPTIGITSDGAVFYHPAAALGLPETVSAGRSRDEGATWDILTPMLGPIPTHPYSQDPYLYVDPTTDRIFVEDLLLVPPTCGMMSISDDGGESWLHTQSGCGNFDHVAIFGGPAVLSPTFDYPNIIYRCAISGGALAGLSTMVTCQRSLDGGLTWQPPGAPAFTFLPGVLNVVAPGEGPLGPCDGGNGHGVVGPDGTVYLPRGHCGQPWLAISHDEGLTWDTVQVSDLGNACTPDSFCEHDAGLAVDPDGNVYYSWVAREDRHLYLVHSGDGGATWSEPRDVTPPGLNEVALVQMTAGGVGKLALAYLGSTTSPGPPFSGDYDDTTWDAYMSVTYDALADDMADGGGDATTFYTTQMNDADDALIRGACGPLRCGAVFDFIDVRIAPDGTPWAPFVDGCFEACNDGAPEDGSEAVTGRLFGGPSLWDAADPNGPYP